MSSTRREEGDVLAEQVDEVLSLLRQAAAEVELSRSNVASFLGEAESLVRGLADLAGEGTK